MASKSQLEAILKLSLAYSPCPNDTFIFHDLALGGQFVLGYALDIHLHDIEVLNQFALEHRYDVTKLSFPAWLRVRDEYRLLGAGAALGFGCGPVLVSKRLIHEEEVPTCRIAIPGELTTAHLLFSLWCKEASQKMFARYDEVMDLVADEKVDCAVVIHEGRFVYEKAGFKKIVDLGEWYEKKTGHPVPLAGIAIRRRFPAELGLEMETRIQAGIENSSSNIERALPYIKRHAQEMSDDVLMRHINTFVTESSVVLGEQGRAAITKLEEMARELKVVP